MNNSDFFNLSLDLMCVIDENKNIIEANESFREILGYSCEEIKGIKVYKLVHKDDVEKTIKELETLKISKKPTNYINRYLKKDGTYCNLEWRIKYLNNKIYAVARELDEKIEIKNKLQASEENFNNFFETTDRMIFVSNESGKIIHINNSVKEKLGYEVQDVKGKNLLDLHPPKLRKEAEKKLNKILIDREGECTFPLKKKNGNLVQVETKIWFGKWNNNDCVYAVCIDISKEQENLEKSNKIFQSNPTIMAINSYETGEFIEVNDSLLKASGYKREEVIGKTIRELNLLVDDELNTVIEKEVKEKGKVENLRVKYKTKKGYERYGLVYSETIETGEKKYILNIMVDVTEERKATLALEYKNKFQEILMEITSEFINSPVEKALNFIDKSLEKIGKFVKADRVYIFDYDFRNRTISNTYEWCDKNIEPQIGYLQEIPMDSVISWVKEHKKGNTIIIPEVESYTGDDQARKILEDQDVKSLITVPMMEEGKCIGFVGFDSVLDYKKYKDEEIQLLKLFAQTILDIRKREKKEEELLNSLEEKSILMKEIHHRVKNNLQLVSSLIFLQSFYIEDIKVKKALKDTENRIKSMAMLHEKIYRAEEINKINFKDYIESIIEELQKH